MEYRIFVGAIQKIKKGFMKGSYQFMYCGMPDADTFVIAPLMFQGYSGFSPSLYYNINISFIQIHEMEFEVLDVNPEYIILDKLITN